MITVDNLWIYPVKSLAGIPTRQAELTTDGLRYDRHWMICDKAGRFVSQRDLPLMSTITTALSKTALRLSCTGRGEIEIPLLAVAGQPCIATVWRSECQVIDEGIAVSRWLTACLGDYRGGALRLVRMQPGFTRQIDDPPWLPGEVSQTRFADAYPFLVCSQQSLALLNRKIEGGGGSPVPMSRFRPNIVLSGLAALQEYQVDVLDCVEGGFSLGLRKPCERCRVTTIDQASGQPQTNHGEPLRSLVQLALANKGLFGGSKKPFFGMNGILTAGAGKVMAVGQQLCADTGVTVDR